MDFFTRFGVDFGEPSTVRGLVNVAIAFAAALGIHLGPEQVDAIIAFGLATSGLVGVFFRDRT